MIYQGEGVFWFIAVRRNSDRFHLNPTSISDGRFLQAMVLDHMNREMLPMNYGLLR